jgi:predicted amino acid-binding ACT domain protein
LNQQNDQSVIKYLENVGLNLNDASKTSDYDKAKEIFKVMCRFEQKINGVDKSILNQNFDLKDLVEKIENTMKELSKNLLKLAKSSSLYVIKERKDYIKRVTSTIHIFEEFLSNLIEFIPSNSRILKFSKSVLACLESFFSIELIFDVLNRLF